MPAVQKILQIRPVARFLVNLQNRNCTIQFSSAIKRSSTTIKPEKQMQTEVSRCIIVKVVIGFIKMLPSLPLVISFLCLYLRETCGLFRTAREGRSKLLNRCFVAQLSVPVPGDSGVVGNCKADKLAKTFIQIWSFQDDAFLSAFWLHEGFFYPHLGVVLLSQRDGVLNV